MPLPVTFAVSYLAINMTLMLWIVREEAGGRTPPGWLTGTSQVLRYLPPLLGAMYLVTRAGDWPFVLFVLVFFAVALFLLDGVLNYPQRPPK